MANGHVEIHDPISNHNDLTSSTNCDPKSTSDTDSMGDTVEFRLLMAYAKRRRPKKDVESPTQDSPITLKGGTEANGSSSPQTPANTEKEEEEEEEKKRRKKKKKKKKGLQRLQRLFICIRPQTGDEEPPQTIASQAVVRDRSGEDDGVQEEDTLEEVASRLTEIADEIPFIPPDVETDSPEDDVEKVIALLLRETGDRLNEKELKNAAITTELFWNYSFFNRLITSFLTRMGLLTDPDTPGPRASPKTQIAVTCEVTSRLSAVDTLPTNRLLGHGARYLQDHYSSWAQQQGGYEEAFYSEDEEDQ